MESNPGNDFPGLYTEYTMPSSSFLHRGDHVYVVLQSLWGSRTTVLFIDTDSGAITDKTKIHANEPMYSWSVLATDSKMRVLCTRSTPTTPADVLLGYFNKHGDLSWKVLDKPVLSEEGTFLSVMPMQSHCHAMPFS